MRDLKHLIYFENLLQEANNELVQQAVKDGKKAVAYTCYHIPEVLLNVGDCFSVRLRAPRTGSLDIATYYMSSYLCGYSKALVERGIEGGYNFLSAFIGSESCSEMNRAYEHFEVLNLVNNPDFFVSISDIPFAGPTGRVVVGSIGDKFIINPTVMESEKSDMHVTVSGTKDAILMVEAGAHEVSERKMLDAIMFAHEEIKKLVRKRGLRLPSLNQLMRLTRKSENMLIVN